MNLRKVIREEISRIFKEDEAGLSPVLGGALTGIENTLSADLNNITNILKTQTTDTKNKDNEIKANLQLKSKLDAQNPHRKGLEREIPEDQKELEVRKKQLKDLQNAQKGIKDAQAEISKQKQDIEAATQDGAQKTTKTTSSILPSLQSPI